MDNKQQFNPELGNIALSALLIDKVHSCTDCPIRGMATKHPKSVFSRLHNWHRTWWPGWKAHQARTCAHSARANAQG